MLWILGIMAAVVAIDQLSKYIARRTLKDRKVKKGPFTFALVFNPGAFRGLFKDKPSMLLAIQIAGTFLVLVMTLITHFFYRNRALTGGLALITGGALGNIVDRIHDGSVTDFVAIKWTRNLYYNLADFAIFLGAAILIITEIMIEVKNALSAKS